MIEETATVVRVEGQFAWVETVRKSACDACAVSKGCGTSVLASVVGNKTTQLKVVNDIAAGVGDEVTIGLQETAMLRGAFLVYLFPLLSLFVFALLGELLASQLLITNRETFVVIFGLTGLIAAFYLIKRRTAFLASDPRYQAIILNKPKRL